MDSARSLFEISGSTVLVRGRPLELSAEGFEVLLERERIDAGTFEFLFIAQASSYAKCRNGLHNAIGRRTVKGIDGQSFQMLNTFWGKDSDSVYSFKTERIHKQIDAESFEVTDAEGGAMDKDFVYSLNSLNAVVKRKRCHR